MVLIASTFDLVEYNFCGSVFVWNSETHPPTTFWDEILMYRVISTLDKVMLRIAQSLTLRTSPDDQAELVRLREQLALKPQYIVLPVRKDVVTNEIGTQTDADVVCPIGFDFYGCSQADGVGENKATLDVNEMESVYGLLAEGGGESDAASVIQHSWRLFVFSRKLNSELQEFARMAVQNQGANEKTRTLVHTVKTISRRTLLVKICGDKLNACGGVYPEWLMKLAELLVDKAMPRKDAVAAENG